MIATVSNQGKKVFLILDDLRAGQRLV